MSAPLFSDFRRQNQQVPIRQHFFKEIAGIFRDWISRAFFPGGTSNGRINDERDRQDQWTFGLICSAASRYRLSASRLVSAKSSGHSPKAPFSSRAALCTFVMPSAYLRNQCRHTSAGSISFSATAVWIESRIREL